MNEVRKLELWYVGEPLAVEGEDPTLLDVFINLLHLTGREFQLGGDGIDEEWDTRGDDE